MLYYTNKPKLEKLELQKKRKRNKHQIICKNTNINKGKRWDVQLDYVRQFKSELVRRLNGLVFEKKKFHSNEREIERERERERERGRERERERGITNQT